MNQEQEEEQKRFETLQITIGVSLMFIEVLVLIWVLSG